MDALKNAASGMFNSSGGAGKPNLAVGGTAAQTGVGAPSAALPATHKPTMFDQGIDAAQNAGILPKTGTQQGNMVDMGQKAYGSYSAGQKK